MIAFTEFIVYRIYFMYSILAGIAPYLNKFAKCFTQMFNKSGSILLGLIGHFWPY